MSQDGYCHQTHVAIVVLKLGLVGEGDSAVTLLEIVVVLVKNVAPRGQCTAALFHQDFVAAIVVAVVSAVVVVYGNVVRLYFVRHLTHVRAHAGQCREHRERDRCHKKL